MVTHWDEIVDPTTVPLYEVPDTYAGNEEAKVPTRVAYGRDNGREEDRYCNQVEDEDLAHYMTKLDFEPPPRPPPTLEEVTDQANMLKVVPPAKKEKEFNPFQQIIVDYLTFCYPRVLARIKQLEQNDLEGVTIVWVFTHPSTWDQERLSIFEKIVRKADFASRATDELIFLPEPDAAAYHCLTQQPTGILQNGTALVGHGAASVGNGVALVADLGVSRCDLPVICACH